MSEPSSSNHNNSAIHTTTGSADEIVRPNNDINNQELVGQKGSHVSNDRMLEHRVSIVDDDNINKKTKNDYLLQDGQKSSANKEHGKSLLSSSVSAANRNTTTTVTHALGQIWQSLEENVHHNESSNHVQQVQKAVQETAALLLQSYNELIQPATKAMMELETTKKENQSLKESCVVKDRELDRLRKSEQQAKTSIQNLFKAVETSNEESKDTTQSKLVEAKMRSDILHLTQEKDNALIENEGLKHRIDLLENDVQNYKSKATKYQNEKLQLERDYCSLQSMVSTLQGSVNVDVEYYKRKVTELNTHLQGMSAVISEKNREIAELRKDRDRQLSQNRLAAMKAGTADNKKRRISY